MRIVISSDPRLLHVLRGMVRYFAKQAGFPEPDVESMTLAIDEAATNVIRHSYRNRRDACLALEILPFADRLDFLLEDSGDKVRPERLRPRPLDQLRPGGLGTLIISSVMDESSYDPDFPGGNRLRMRRYLSRKGASSDESASQERG